jgi:hypothetical protein
MSVVLQIPGVKEWFADVFEKLRTTNIKDVANAVKEKTGYYINNKFVQVEQTPPENIIVTDNETPIVVEPESQQPYVVDKNGQPEQIGWDKVGEVAPDTKVPDPIGLMYKTENGQEIINNSQFHSEPIILDLDDKEIRHSIARKVVNGMSSSVETTTLEDQVLRMQIFKMNDGSFKLHIMGFNDEKTIIDSYKYGIEASNITSIQGAGKEVVVELTHMPDNITDAASATDFFNDWFWNDDEIIGKIFNHLEKGKNVTREIKLDTNTGEILSAVVK